MNPAPDDPRERELRLLTWNIFLMPPIVHESPKNQRRAAAVASELLKLDLDVLCFQKVFDDHARRILENAFELRYPYRWGPANPGGLLTTSSGVWVVSRFPMWGYRDIEFRKKAGVERFSHKGAIFLAGTVAGREFHLVATHLQGDDGPAYNAEHQVIRDWQMRQIQEELVVPNAKPGVPVFFCGDFCTPRRDPLGVNPEGDGYRFMLDTFQAETGPEERITLDDTRARNDLASDDTKRTDELDYILVKPSGYPRQGTWERLILQHEGWDGAGGRRDLSYRYAVTARFVFA